VQRYLKAANDPRYVVSDVHARYFGAELKDDTLVPARTRASVNSASMPGSRCRRHRVNASASATTGSGMASRL
jgi:hypothetical protein